MEEHYIISDVSKLIDVEPHVLRYWEEELSLNITRNQLGHRYYKEKDLELLRKIKTLKEQGMQLKAIKMLLTTHSFSEEPEMELRHSMTVSEPKPIEGSTSKLKLFEQFMKEVIQTSLKENNEVLKDELTNEVAVQMKTMLSMQEEMEEKRFRKLDETIREIQRGRQEVAVSKQKNRFLTKRKDKS